MRQRQLIFIENDEAKTEMCIVCEFNLHEYSAIDVSCELHRPRQQMSEW